MTIHNFENIVSKIYIMHAFGVYIMPSLCDGTNNVCKT